MNRYIIGCWLLAMVLWGTQAQAQVGTYKRLELGAGISATQYTGDLANMPALNNTRVGGEVHFRYNFNTYFAGRLFFGVGTLAGTPSNSRDPFIQSKGRAFRSSYYDFGGVFEYNFLNFRGTRETYAFSPYVFAGFGTTSVTVKNLQKTYLGSTGMVPMIPFGLGVKAQLGYRFNLAFEFRTCKPFSDYVDALDANGGIPGYNTKQDLYYNLGVSVSYRFITIRCPESALDYAGER